MFFLFQLLTPLVGYFESGAIVCAIVASMGLILLYCGQEQKQRLPMEGLFNQAQEVLKKTEVSLDEMVTNNTSKILLGAFITGVTLSQMKNLGTRK